ncbi:hypothetical protein Ddc_16061 [Ditylenchus destructor]|nr:hypothetical protein Ddc_16061 [Ditylenchus destructor]
MRESSLGRPKVETFHWDRNILTWDASSPGMVRSPGMPLRFLSSKIKMVIVKHLIHDIMIQQHNAAPLSNLMEVPAEIEQTKLKEIGEKVLKYNHESDVQVVSPPLGGPLEANKAFLEQQVGKKRQVKLVSLDEIREKKASPIVFACADDGTWAPVVFALDEDVCGTPWKDDAFLKEVGQFLVANSLNREILLASRTSKDAKDRGMQFLGQLCGRSVTFWHC